MNVSQKFKLQSGIGMIEILITVVIIAVGLLGVAVSQTTAIKETSNSAQRTAAILMIDDLIERMRMNHSAINSYKSAINGNCPTSAPTNVCGTGYSNKAVVNGASCTAAQQAAYDLWDVFCDKRNVDGKKGKSGNADYLSNRLIRMRCVDPSTGTERATTVACEKDDMVQIELQWIESKNARKTEQDANARTFKVDGRKTAKQKIKIRTAL